MNRATATPTLSPPMIVNIGGLSVGVAVALFILPIYYALMNGDKKRVVLDI